jgi:hypothetical protein
VCASFLSPKVWLVGACLLAAGCGNRDEIRSYDVPKTPAPATAAKSEGAKSEPAEPSDAKDRMIAVGVFPEGAHAWFFKIAGLAATVDGQEKAFRAFVESAKFDGPSPTWTVPVGWKPKQAGMMQHAAFDAGEPAVEVSVARLPKPQGDDAEYILNNVNRWRGQMSLSAIGAGDLAKNVQERAIGTAKATWVDLRGTLQKGMRPPFAR